MISDGVTIKMTGVIVFRIEIKKEYGGFISASNFITKMSQGQILSQEETRGIKNYLWKGSMTPGNRQLAELASSKAGKFLDIKKPELLSKGITGYQVVYCLYAEEEEILDIVELQYYFLMKKYFGEHLLAILVGGNDFYFKSSHYFMSVTNQEQKFYESVFFYDGSRVQLLQKENIIRVKDFVPLQSVTQKTRDELHQKLGKRFSAEAVRACIFDPAKAEKESTSPIMRGCFSLLHKGAHIFEKIDQECLEQLIGELMEGTVLTFILFSYSFYECMRKGGKRSESELSKTALSFFQQTKECAMCCQQLIDNVIFHSESKVGTLSVRFHSKRNAYMTTRYGLEVRDIPYLEVQITDYAGVNHSGNLALNFINNIEDPEMRQWFTRLQPIDFFAEECGGQERKAEIKRAFCEYYSHSQNIGRHYGLKIFRSIIQKNQGRFAFYSHNSHKIEAGESQGFTENNVGSLFAQCMPGTSYALLFPLEERVISLTRALVSIDKNEKLNMEVQYACRDKELAFHELSYNNSKEKEEQIRMLAGKLLEEDNHKSTKTEPEFAVQSDKGPPEHKVVYISAGAFSDDMAECLCKSLLIAAHGKQIPDYVFYNCTKAFVKLFQQSINVYYGLGTMSAVYKEFPFLITLYTAEPIEETIIVPHSISLTRLANRESSFTGEGGNEGEWLIDLEEPQLSDKENMIIPPFDILHKVEMNGRLMTIFEHYTLQILETDIQDTAFGCKIFNTHMRLGSTIHINSFYEAELLFSNWLFISRFSYLLMRDIEKDSSFRMAQNITLYSYALYSELLIFETMNLLKSRYPEKEFDYAILERESDHRTLFQTDRIRYSHPFESEEERKLYYKDRKVICIVPINSTLKTHEKLIDRFCEDNKTFQQSNIIMNFAIVLVGSKERNKYWTIDEKNRTFLDIKLEIKPEPHYFVAVKVDYQEALGCELCFPKSPLEEIPLIEVNASSTIPNQSFGLYRRETKKTPIDAGWIMEEEQQLKVLNKSLLYSHIERGENHFSYYFKTDTLFLENKEEIEKWLGEVSAKIDISSEDYHILVCPSHFSNAGFLEYVNKIIFHEAALIIRVDVDKEYRSNIETKYSSVKAFLRMLDRENSGQKKVRVYFIDDSIITGRTYRRAKSLISSVTGIYEEQYKNVQITIFDKIIVLVDRNSAQTRMQYIDHRRRGTILTGDLDHNFFAFRSVKISSMRNHGDSCVLCQLERQATILHQASATKVMSEHWKEQEEKFKTKFLVDKRRKKSLTGHQTEEEEKEEKAKTDPCKAYRRMICTHVATIVLNEKNHGNRKEEAVFCILELLLSDYRKRSKISQEEAFEFFLSYLKVISRPFLAFTKAIREAVFDIMLVFAEYLLSGSKINDICSGLGKSKPYIAENKKRFSDVAEEIIDKMDQKEQKANFFQLLMTQLIELRSNYFIRPENIRRLSAFVKPFEDGVQTKIYNRYLYMVKKLLGVNSDTSKSAWFSDQISALSCEDTMGLPKDIFELLVLENTRGYHDGLKRISKSVVFSEDILSYLCQVTEDNDDTMANRLGTLLNPEIRKPQYRDLREILRNYKWMENKELTKAGAISLAAGMELMNRADEAKKHGLNNPDNEDIWKQCLTIACLMDKILQAKSVRLILGHPLECDLWEDRVKAEFNGLVSRYEKENELKELKLEGNCRKEYFVLANSGEIKRQEDNKVKHLMPEIVSKLKDYRKLNANAGKGYYLSEEEKYMIWEIGQDGAHPIIVYAEFFEFQFPEILQRIRNVMMMNFYFNEYVFNQKTLNHLYELMVAEKEKLVYNNKKFDSHTAEEVRDRQYQSLLPDSKNTSNYYPSYVLTLLADLQVSEIYRTSLGEDYYCRRLRLKTVGWENTPLKIGHTFTVYGVSTGINKYVRVSVITDEILFEDEELLLSSDHVIAYNFASGLRQTFLMIVTLIMNAAVNGRAPNESKNREESTSEISVYLTKTKNGNLRIKNRSSIDRPLVEDIIDGMEYPPGKNQGISLWSMARYIKGITSILAEHALIRLSAQLSCMGEAECIAILREKKGTIETLLSERFQVKVDERTDGETKYFCVDIPILAEKYQEFRELF